MARPPAVPGRDVRRDHRPGPAGPRVAPERRPARRERAAAAGFGSCLVLPLRTDRQPAGAVALYGQQRHAFREAAHNIALLSAAQEGTAVRNAALYRQGRQMISNLHAALESQAFIEQVKSILRAQFGVSPDEAFQLLSHVSQDTNRKVRIISAGLVQGRIDVASFRPAGQRGAQSWGTRTRSAHR